MMMMMMVVVVGSWDPRLGNIVTLSTMASGKPLALSVGVEKLLRI